MNKTENMEFKGTKGIWVIENLHNPKEGKYPASEIDISTEYEENMCTVWFSDMFDEQAKANALLISKAPEMFEMLLKLCFTAPNDTLQITELIYEAEKLIKEVNEL